MTGVVEFRKSPTSVVASDSNEDFSSTQELNKKVDRIRDSELKTDEIDPSIVENLSNRIEVVDSEIINIVILALKDLKMKRILETREAFQSGTLDVYEPKQFDYKDLMEAASKRIQELDEEKRGQEEIKRFERLAVECVNNFIKVAVVSMIVGCLFKYS